MCICLRENGEFFEESQGTQEKRRKKENEHDEIKRYDPAGAMDLLADVSKRDQCDLIPFKFRCPKGDLPATLQLTLEIDRNEVML